MLINRRIVLAVPAVVLLLASMTPAQAQNTRPAAPAEINELSGVLRGSGSTFAARYYSAVALVLSGSAKRVKIDYRAVGSGRGKAEFGKNLTDFAGTDSAVKDTDGPKAGEFLYVPTTAGAITVAFNLRGVDDLRMSAPTIAKIFQRDIRRWDDPAIAAENPDVRLPNRAIGVVHRSDRSGTTSNFTKYLEGAAPGVWRLGSGDAIRWPSATSQGEGNRSVAQIVANNNGSIAYVDLANALALRLRTVAVLNKAGEYVRPTGAGVTAALAAVTLADDLTYKPLDAGGDEAYPITSPTYLLVRTRYADQRSVDLVTAYLRFILTKGQDVALQSGYARLPDSIRDRALAQLDKIAVR